MGPGSAGTNKDNKKKKKIPKVEEFLQNRDFTGARTLLEVYYGYVFVFKQKIINEYRQQNYCNLQQKQKSQ